MLYFYYLVAVDRAVDVAPGQCIYCTKDGFGGSHTVHQSPRNPEIQEFDAVMRDFDLRSRCLQPENLTNNLGDLFTLPLTL